MALVKTMPSNFARLISLFVAFLGCAVAAVPMYFALAEPVPLILIGSGIAVVALAGFLFVSI